MRRIFPLILGLLILAFLLPTAAAAKPPTTGDVKVDITGTLQGGGGDVDGEFVIERFAKRSGGIVALGTFNGSVTDASGNVTTGEQDIALPVGLAFAGAASQAVIAQQATCDVLFLQLGPLDLNLLGLAVHLDQVTLEITAEQGPGNLLGNLLCAIAGLLDPGPGPLDAIVALLNQVLGILQGL